MRTGRSEWRRRKNRIEDRWRGTPLPFVREAHEREKKVREKKNAIRCLLEQKLLSSLLLLLTMMFASRYISFPPLLTFIFELQLDFKLMRREGIDSHSQTVCFNTESNRELFFANDCCFFQIDMRQQTHAVKIQAAAEKPAPPSLIRLI